LISKNRIQFQLLTLLISIVIFSSDSFTVSGKQKELNKEFASSLERNEIFPSNLSGRSHFFSSDTNLTLKQLDSLREDSLKLGLIKIDSSKFDSTARIKHFNYARKDNKFLTKVS